LLARRPLEEISIDDIADAADVARASFYNHFPNKESVAEEICEDVRSSIAQRIADLNQHEPDPVLRICRGFCVVLWFGFSHRSESIALTRVMPRTVAFDAPINKLAREDIRLGLASGDFRGIDADDGLLMAIGGSMLTLEYGLGQDRIASAPRAFAATHSAALLRGLGVEFHIAQAAATRFADEVFQN
jgi:AcrR family transcriptional regulator